jgi:hypothetical protein
MFDHLQVHCMPLLMNSSCCCRTANGKSPTRQVKSHTRLPSHTIDRLSADFSQRTMLTMMTIDSVRECQNRVETNQKHLSLLLLLGKKSLIKESTLWRLRVGSPFVAFSRSL